MDLQNIIAGIIILAAIFYFALRLKRKIKAFSPKNASCGTDCGCKK